MVLERKRFLLCISVLFALTLSACSCSDDEGDGGADGGGNDSGANDGATNDGRSGDGSQNPGDGALSDARAAYCRGDGPPLVVGDSANPEQTECTGRLAENAFRYAVCTCDGIVTSSTLSTDSFDSDEGPYMAPGEAGGSFGTNAGLSSSADWSIGGSLWASGASGWTGSQTLSVASELHLAGRVAGDTVEVAGDAYVAGGVGLSTFRVDGTLVVPEGENITIVNDSVANLERAPVEVQDPCACEDDQIADINGFVAHHAGDNDNEVVDLDAQALENVAEATTLELPCGRYYLDGITASEPIVVRAQGRVALFVGGDISVGSELDFQVDEGAEVDIFVAGNVNVSGELSIGSQAAPARARLYVGGSGTINLAGNSVFAGNIYAPRSELVTAGDAEIFGAVFARRIAASGSLDIHYDSAILTVGDACEPPPVCQTCADCDSAQACNGGTCGACETNADCCAPLLCQAGSCVPLIR